MPESSFGVWWDPASPDEKVAGSLNLEPLVPPTLSLLDPPVEMLRLDDGRGSFFGGQSEMLLGTLADQGWATLLNCQSTGFRHGKTSTNELLVGIVLVGVRLDQPDEAFVRRLEIELPHLDLLLGAAPTDFRPVTGRARHIKIPLRTDRYTWGTDGVEITWRYNWGASFSRNRTDVRHTPTVILTSRTSRSIQYWIDEWVIPINELVQVATGTKSNPTRIRAWMKKHPTKEEKSTRNIDVWQRGVGESEVMVLKTRVLFTASEIDCSDDGLIGVLGRLRTLTVEHAVFLEQLSAAILYPDRPLENRYLDLVSGIEAYHAGSRGAGPIPEDEFKARRKALLVELKDVLDEPDHKFVKRWLLNRSSYSLENRLTELATDADLLESWDVDPSEMAQLRNDLAHGNTGVDRRRLHDATGQAFDLARRIVLQELGIPALP